MRKVAKAVGTKRRALPAAGRASTLASQNEIPTSTPASNTERCRLTKGSTSRRTFAPRKARTSRRGMKIAFSTSAPAAMMRTWVGMGRRVFQIVRHRQKRQRCPLQRRGAHTSRQTAGVDDVEVERENCEQEKIRVSGHGVPR
jgi:hypothetical protein